MWVETTFKAAQSNREALDGVVLPCLRSACSTGELQGFKQLVTENLAPVTESCSAAGQVAVNKTVEAIQEAPTCLRSCWSNSKPYTTDKLRELCVQHQAGFPNPVPLNIDTMSTAMSRCPFDVCRKTNATDSDTLLSLLTSATFRDNMNLACGLMPVSTDHFTSFYSGIATRLGCLLLPIPAIII
ncbi:hypothetical protein BDR26DRAFT_860816 [Obelidium mucronatum]|nr:hypothetical protein BDR26DRAFT_860816 [Obelidium mucronatum]